MRIPYGKTGIELPEEAGMTVVTSSVSSLKSAEAGSAMVERAMEQPIGGRTLTELARGKKTCTILISDHTRPVPSRDILPAMLRALREGSPAIEVLLLVATGAHRGTTEEELRQKLGEDIFQNCRIKVHDCDRDNVSLGILPSGAELMIDAAAVDTELLVAEGFIEPHFFAGFSGGRKSVLPGICDRRTVFGNHCGQFIASERSRTGILEGNPIHEDMLAAARMAKLQYIVNVIIDEDKKTVAAFAGEPEAAHAAGVAFLRRYCEAPAGKTDITITTNGGAPLDQNVYQCVKGMTAAEAANREGGVIILAAECADGMGGDAFYRSLSECKDAASLYEQYCATPQKDTIQDQWQSQILARVLMHHTVIFVTRKELKSAIEAMKMQYAPDLTAALQQARALVGAAASVSVIPDGVSVMICEAE